MRPVTQTDVVRAGTRDVAKIFQILYDVDAVSGPGSITYLGVTNETRKNLNPSLYTTALENSPSVNMSTMSTATLQNVESFSDSAMSTTLRSEDFPGRLSYDAVSIGSNDSGDVTFLFSLDILLNIVISKIT